MSRFAERALVHDEAREQAVRHVLHEVSARGIERIRVNGSFKERVLHRKKKVLDDDLPVIAAAFAEFRKRNREPGA